MLAIVAPGQGSQTPGMLSSWLEDSTLLSLTKKWSDEIGVDLVSLGTTADADEIRDTANAQPLIVAAGLLSARALFGAATQASVIAGHSVGELTAAALSQTISESASLALVRARGVEMAKAAAISPAGMSAVLGGDRAEVLAAIAAAGLVAANDNGGGQIVAAGSLEALASLAPDGARVRQLQVAGAFHTHFMEPVLRPFSDFASTIEVRDSAVGVLSNRDGAVLHNGVEIRDRIVTQVAHPVRWDLCMATLESSGVTGAIEVAPAGTLVGLLKRGVPAIEGFALKSPDELAEASAFAQVFTKGKE